MYIMYTHRHERASRERVKTTLNQVFSTLAAPLAESVDDRSPKPDAKTTAVQTLSNVP